jgi:hypothetical protein
MTMGSRLRKLALTAHITSSVGWLGAVATVLALAIAGLTYQDGLLVRAAYLAMEPIVSFVIVPLAFASLLTGLVQSLGTAWGLFRHYWVLLKLLITVLVTLLLLQYTRTIGHITDAAADATTSSADLRTLGVSPLLHAGLALLALLVPAAVSVFKPPGMTPYGWRKQKEQRPVRSRAGAPRHGGGR